MDKYKGFELLWEYEKDGDTRMKFINSAIYLFSTNGFLTTSTKEVANHAQYSEAMLFKLFKNKQNLLDEVSMEIIVNRLPSILGLYIDDVLSEEIKLTSINEIKTLLINKYKFLEQNMGYVKILLLELSNNSLDIISKIKSLLDILFTKLTMLIDRLKEADIVRKDIDSRTIFRSLAGMLVFTVLDVNHFKQNLDIEKEIEKILILYFEGAKKNEK
jgi:AcrR family transcriptional regulator